MKGQDIKYVALKSQAESKVIFCISKLTVRGLPASPLHWSACSSPSLSKHSCLCTLLLSHHYLEAGFQCRSWSGCEGHSTS